MRRSIVLSLPLQSVFPALTLAATSWLNLETDLSLIRLMKRIICKQTARL
jgi:hypothetical protein